MNKLSKEYEYAAKLTAQITAIFDEDCENYIDESSLEEGRNATHFIHALLNIATTCVANGLTDADNNMLQNNHMANHLCFQYGKKEDGTKD